MTPPGDGHEHESLQQTQPTQPIQSSQSTQPAHDEHEKGSNGGRLARRAALAVVGLGLCAGAVELTPIAAQKVGEYTEAELRDAFKAGADAGRQALLSELRQIEGVTLDGAIDVAELTKLAVRYIVVPLANLTATIEGDALQVLINAVSLAISTLAHFNITIGLLNNLRDLLTQWHSSVTQLPIALNNYATTDITLAETYLKALKAKLAEPDSTPTATGG